MNTETIQTADLKTQLANLLSGDLAAVNAILRRRLRSSSDFVSDITEHVSRFQGKQIRPILLLLFERAIAGHSSECGKTLAAAVEMIHTATLVHDDVIDEAETRRHVEPFTDAGIQRPAFCWVTICFPNLSIWQHPPATPKPVA